MSWGLVPVPLGMAGLIVTISLLSILTVTNGQPPFCYQDLPRPREWAISPGDYDPLVMQATVCQARCSVWQFDYAALLENGYCLCGTETTAKVHNPAGCTETCPGNVGETCGGPDSYVSMNPAPALITGLGIKVIGPTVVRAFGDVTFNVTIDRLGPTYEFHYDWGNADRTDSLGQDLQPVHYFTSAGDFIVTVEARDSAGIVPSMWAATSVMVHSGARHVQIMCPEVWLSLQQINCNITIMEGTYIQAAIDYNDTNTETFSVADAVAFSAGLSIPSTPTPGVLPNTDRLYISRTGDFQRAGRVVAFEFVARQTGDVEFVVLRVSCGNGNLFCASTNDCPGTCSNTLDTGTCTGTQQYCGSAEMCTASNHPAGCTHGNRYGLPDANIDYAVVSVIPFTIAATGRQHLQLDPDLYDVWVTPGDVIGWQSAGVGLIESVVAATDEADLEATATHVEGDTLNEVTDTTVLTGHRHLLRAVAAQPSVVQLYHTFATHGNFTVTANVSNEHLPDFAEGNFTVVILEAIDFIIIDAPEFGSLDTPVLFTILPHTGSGVKYDWDWDDGGAETADIRFINHTFTALGTYNVTVKGYNDLMALYNYSLITLEEEIESIEMFSETGLTDIAHPVTLNISSGSDYVCDIDWNDGVTERYNVTAVPPRNVSTLTHTWGRGGVYSVTSRCFNHVSDVTITYVVLIGGGIENLHFVKEGAKVGEPFFLEFALDEGDNCTFNITFDGEQIPYVYDEQTKQGQSLNSFVKNNLEVINLTLLAENLVASEYIFVNFTIEHEIINARVTPEDLQILRWYDTLGYDVTMDAGSSAEILVEFRDGSNDSFKMPSLMDWHLRVNAIELFPHMWAVPGVFEVLIVVQNAFSSHSFTRHVKVFNEVANITLNTNSPVAFIRTGELHFWYVSLWYPPTEASITCDFGDGQVTASPLAFVDRKQYTQPYSSTGVYILQCNVSNLISWQNYSTEVILEVPVTNLQVVADPPHVEVNTPVWINVSMDLGENVELTWDFGDGTPVIMAQRQGQTMYELDTQSHAYAAVGTYLITVTAENILGNTTVKYIIQVQYTVMDCFTVTVVPQNIPYFGSPVPVTVTLTFDNGKIYPSDPYMLWTFGDYDGLTLPGPTVEPMPNVLLQTGPSFSYSLSHTYTGPGDYYINVTIFNLATRQEIVEPSGVFEAISGFTVSALYTPLIPPGSGPQPGFSAGTLFPANIPVEFHTSLTSGTVVEYRVQAADALIPTNVVTYDCPAETCPAYTPLALITSATYHVTTTAWNPLSSGSSPLQISLREVPAGMTLTDLDPQTALGSPRTLRLQINTLGDNTVLRVDSGLLPTAYVYYGAPADVTDNYGAVPAGSVLGPASNTMDFTHTYTEAQSYTMEVEATNVVHRDTVEIQFTQVAADESCAAPKVYVKGGEKYPNAIQFKRSTFFELFGVTELGCADTLQNNKEWRIFELNPNGTRGAEVDLSGLPSALTGHLVVPALFLDFGYYEVQFKVTMDPLDTFLAASTSAINIGRSGLIALMLEGGMSTVKRTYGTDVTLPANMHSRDPDLEQSEPQGLSFAWFCRRIDEEYPVYPNGSLIENVGLQTPYTVAQLNGTAPPPDLGGCFRQGPGALDPGPEPGVLSFNTLNMELNETYEIMLIIRKNDREQRTTLLMDVRVEEMPDVIINCPPAIGFPVTGGMLINANNRIALTSCVTSCSSQYEPSDSGPASGTYSIQWVVERQGLNGAWIEVLDIEPYVAGITSQSIAISSDLMKDDQELYNREINYRVTILIDGVVGAPGQASTVLFVNRPPSGGSCTVEPSSARVGDQYTVACSDWTDEQGVDEYNVFVRRPDGSLWQITYEEGTLGFLVQPPMGLVDQDYLWPLVVRVVDTIGGDVYYEVGNITVSPVPTNEYEANMDTWLVDDGPLATTIAEVNEGEMLETFPGIANMVDGRTELVRESARSAVYSEIMAVTGGVEIPPEFQAIVDSPAAATTDDLLVAMALLERDGSASVTQYITSLNSIRFEATQVLANMTDAIQGILVSIPPDVDSLRNVAVMMRYIFHSPSTVSRSMQETGASIVNTLSDLLLTMQDSAPLEELLSVSQPLLDIMSVLYESVVQNIANPTLVDQYRATQDELYIFDTDWESTRADVGYSDDSNALVMDTNQILQKDVAQSIQPSMLDAIRSMTQTLSKALVGGESPARVSSTTMEAVVYSDTRLALLNANSSVPTSYGHDYSLPTEIFDGYDDNDVFSIALVAMEVNPIIYDQNTSAITLPLLEITIRDPDNNVMSLDQLTEPLSVGFFHNLTFPVKEEVGPFLPPQNAGRPKRFGFYHSLWLGMGSHGLMIGVEPKVAPGEDIMNMAYLLCLATARFPNYTDAGGWDCDWWTVLPDLTRDDPWSSVVSNMNMNNTNGKITVLVRELHADERAAFVVDATTPPIPVTAQENVFDQLRYDLYTCNCSCSYYDEQNQRLDFMGGRVDEARTNLTMLYCLWDHMTLFGGGFVVQPNAIDWNFVFANLDFYKNMTLYITEIVVAFLYIVVMIWARREDKRDVIRLGVTPLPDNDPQDKYLYEIIVYTGMGRNAGTDSKVHVILSGDDDESDVRVLSDEKRKVLKRGNCDAFLMTTSRCLGKLNFMRVFHDNSGRGKHASWYLKYVIVTDLQTSDKFYFLLDRWLAVEEDDGQIDRVVPMAGREQMVQFGYLFTQSTRKKFGDDHLWFSVVTRPPQSRFTRVQRVSCCLLLLFTSMLANAMFYEQTATAGDSSTVVSLGPFALTPEQLYVGVITNLVVFPVNFLVVWLFRKARNRKKRPCRVKRAITRQARRQRHGRSSVSDTHSLCNSKYGDEEAGIGDKRQFDSDESDGDELPPGYTSRKPKDPDPADDRPRTAGQIEIEEKQNEKNGASGDDDKKKKEKKKKKKAMSIPWGWKVVAWILLWLSVLVSAFFVTMYGIQFGDIKCKKWITSLLISFVTSIFLTQPITVVLTAALLSIVFKDPHVNEEEAEEDEEALDIAPDEDYLHSPEYQAYRAARPRKIDLVPPDPEVIERAREQRMKELKMYDIFREIAFYAFFLWVLMVVSYGFRDPKAYIMRNNMRYTFIDQGLGHIDTFLDDFYKVGKIASFWDWANNTLLPGMRAWRWYNGDWLPGQRGFVHDRVSRIMGYATMRQVRMPHGDCEVERIMRPLVPMCHDAYDIFKEETRDFYAGWIPPEGARPPNATMPAEYRYRTASELDSYPYLARRALYGGGGYVFEMRGSLPDLYQKLARIKESGWIDRFSRAIFIELTVYNAQVNLFSIVTMTAEMLTSGGVITMFRVEPVNLLAYDSGGALFTIICQITYLIFILVFCVKEIRNMRREGKKYFGQFWNWVELAIICLSVAGVVIFFYRFLITKKLTELFAASGGNAYMKFQYVGMWHELLLYLLGCLVFLANLKFIKLLRFNRRMSLLASTLKDAGKHLVWFAVIFMVVFLAYTQFFYLIYLDSLINFSSFLVASETCMQMMLGRFDFFEMQQASPWLGPIFFLSYVVAVAYILINMFLSIINESFSAVRVDITKQCNDYEMVDFIMGRMKTLIGVGSKPQMTLPGDTDKDGTSGEITGDWDRYGALVSPSQKQITDFPSKVDRLMSYVSKVYALDTEWQETIALDQMTKKKGLAKDY